MPAGKRSELRESSAVLRDAIKRGWQGDLSAFREIEQIGEPAIEAVLAAIKGPIPSGLDFRDAWDNAGAMLAAAARRQAGPLVELLNAGGENEPLLFVCWALGSSRDRRAADPLIRALEHRNADVREWAARALIQRRDAKAKDALLERLNDPKSSVWGAVLSGIHEVPVFQDMRAIPTLKKLLGRKILARRPGYRYTIESTLQKLEGSADPALPRDVNLEQERVTLERISSLLDGHAVRTLNLCECKGVSDAILRKVARHTELESLNLDSYGRRSFDFSRLIRLVNLRKLSLRNIDLTLEGARKIARLTRLEELDLSGTGMTDAHLDLLKPLQHLRSIILDWRVTDVGFSLLARFPELEAIQLHSGQVTAAGLSHLRTLRGLHRVRLDHSHIGNEGAAELGRHRRLRVLRLVGAGLTDAGLASLSKLISLRTLDLAGNRITDQGLQSLTGLRSLRGIDLRGTRITPDAARWLRQLPRLEHVIVYGTKFGRAGQQALRRALPKCRVNEVVFLPAELDR